MLAFLESCRGFREREREAFDAVTISLHGPFLDLRFFLGSLRSAHQRHMTVRFFSEIKALVPFKFTLITLRLQVQILLPQPEKSPSTQ